jgi:hypothetical protein
MGKLKVCAVTGYVPIVGHPRTAAEYGELGEMFKHMKHDVYPMYQRLDDCFLKQSVDHLEELSSRKVTWSKGDNELKNSLAYHCVNHEKFKWIYLAAKGWPNYDAYVWLDYGIARLPGVTPEVIDACFSRVRKNELAIPGCWERFDPRVEQTLDSNYYPCWRFCGSMFIVPKYMTKDLYEAVRAVARVRLRTTNHVTWEVNTLAETERVLKNLPIKWYKADHDASMFTQYNNQ